jgi:hypothetical protein
MLSDVYIVRSYSMVSHSPFPLPQGVVFMQCCFKETATLSKNLFAKTFHPVKEMWHIYYNSSQHRKQSFSIFPSLAGMSLSKFSLARNNLYMHRKKSFSIFPSPAGMSLTKLSLGGNYDVICKLFLSRVSLISDIPAGTGISKSLSYGVTS